jgi:hypothetical protein
LFLTPVPPTAAGAAEITDFYREFASVSFTLLGLWWVVVQLRYKSGEGSRRRRRHAYGVTLFFLLPGLASMVSSINGGIAGLWRLAFGICAAAGVVEAVLYLRAGGHPTIPAAGLRLFGLVLYVLMGALAIRPQLAVDLDVGLAPREVEAVLLALLLVVGANLVLLSLTESEDTSGA